MNNTNESVAEDVFELERVSRQLRLPGLDQQRLASARVVVIGAGGLGCPVLQALAAAGVRHLTVIDDDVVSISNLQRQFLYGASDVSKSKVAVAAEKLSNMQPGIKVDCHRVRLDATNALQLLDGHDVIVDCTDLFTSKYLIADAAEILGIPLVWGTVLAYEGSVAVFDTDVVGLRDLYPTAPDHLPTCAEAGVLGATTAVVGSLMASEAIKICAGLPSAIGRLITYDALAARFRNFALRREPGRKRATDLSHHWVPDLLLDVREANEREADIRFANSQHLPVGKQTEENITTVCQRYQNKTIGVYCASGARAAQFVATWSTFAARFGVSLVAI